jgi:hypothetical protein
MLPSSHLTLHVPLTQRISMQKSRDPNFQKAGNVGSIPSKTSSRKGVEVIIQIPHPLDPFLNKPSQWAIDVDKSEDYFKTGVAVRRKLRTANGDLLLVARHHFTISDYVSALTSVGVRIIEILEPRAKASVVAAEATLARESQLPSSMIFVGSL